MDHASLVPTIETERLVLRGHRVGDFPDSASMWADTKVVAHISGQPAPPSNRGHACCAMRVIGTIWATGIGLSRSNAMAVSWGSRSCRLPSGYGAIAGWKAGSRLGLQGERAWKGLRDRGGGRDDGMGRCQSVLHAFLCDVRPGPFSVHECCEKGRFLQRGAGAVWRPGSLVHGTRTTIAIFRTAESGDDHRKVGTPDRQGRTTPARGTVIRLCQGPVFRGSRPGACPARDSRHRHG